MANFKNTGDIYVSKNGSDANAGTNPDLPKLTIASALSVTVAGDVIVVGDGIWNEVGLAFGNQILQGESLTILEGDGITRLASTGSVNANNCIFIDQAGISQSRGITFNQCFFINVQQIINIAGTGTSIWNECVFINSVGGKNGHVSQINRSIFINSQYEGNNVSSFAKNSYFDDTSTIEIADAPTVAYEYNSIFATIQDSTTTYTLDEAKAAFPTIFLATNKELVANFNKLVGEIETLDTSVQGTSQLLGAGENGINIGNVRRGLPQSRLSASVQNGTNTNIVFDGNVWQVQSGQTTGTIETDVIDFGLTVKSPKITVKGLVNFLDNVPDFDNTLVDPNKLDIEARYAIIGEDISLKTYKPFLLNERMLLDVGGNTNGESGFDWANTVTIPMKEIQLRITIRQDYNPA